MDLKRIWQHVLMNEFQVKRSFPESVLDAIQNSIKQSELTHHAEIRFVVEQELTWSQLLADITPRARALEVFSNLRIWDTEENNGVLVYVMLADRSVEIVADRGVNKHAGDEFWRNVCQSIQAEFRAGRFEAGAVKGIDAISALLQKHYSHQGDNPNELPDRPLLI